jgi:hypothetical protein
MNRLVPRAIARRYLDIKRRLDVLETQAWHLDTAVDALLVNRTYRPEAAFNGQERRAEIFGDVIEALGPEATVETGTWLGDTTGYMAEVSGLPVYSCESEPRFHAIAQMRLADVEGVHLSLSDSRAFLHEMADRLAGQSVFFYLDAHWYDDLPLWDELDIITTRWEKFAVMVDDFQVPGDPGYGFDDYGEGKVLSQDRLPAALVAHVPSAPSHTETGKRRGSVVLAPFTINVPSLRVI